MDAGVWKPYVHPNWDSMPDSRSEKHYFVRLDAAELAKAFSEIQYQLSIEVPKALKEFYTETGFGFLWFRSKQKKGRYRILSPEELLELYFEPDDEEAPDNFITCRESAWNRLEEQQLLAFCLFGGEDSLLSIGLSDGAVYYLSQKIADSLSSFLDQLDENVDYFLK